MSKLVAFLPQRARIRADRWLREDPYRQGHADLATGCG
jgi:hypothetical protein